MKKRVAVLISGNGSNLQALMDACSNPQFPAHIIQVISNKADAYGLQRAAQAGIPTQVISHKDYSDRESFDSALHAALQGCEADIVCLAGFMRLLTTAFVEKWQGRMLNIHPSLLPNFKGLDTHQRAIEAGRQSAGCTVHYVVPEMDAGPIIAQAQVPILAEDTMTTLAARVFEQEHRIYPEALRRVAQTLPE